MQITLSLPQLFCVNRNSRTILRWAHVPSREPSNELTIMDNDRDGDLSGCVCLSCEWAKWAGTIDADAGFRRLHRAIAWHGRAGQQGPGQARSGGNQWRCDTGRRPDGTGNLQCPKCIIASLLHRDPASTPSHAIAGWHRVSPLPRRPARRDGPRPPAAACRVRA
jgi:hypothetical protein